MDAHFHEYLAAVAGMQDLYGHAADEQPTEFHGDVTVAASAAAVVDRAPLAASI